MLTVLVVSGIKVSALQKAETNPYPYQRLVVTLLYDDIKTAINEYYDYQPRGYDLYNAEVTKLEPTRGWSNFNVTIEVESFYGPHNPPHALEIMTFKIALAEEPELINYVHEDL